jgi:hypothetical protein
MNDVQDVRLQRPAIADLVLVDGCEQRLESTRRPVRSIDLLKVCAERLCARRRAYISDSNAKLVLRSLVIEPYKFDTAIGVEAQAAEALKPPAEAFAELIFALGIIGTGLLAIPVLAGSSAYAIGEGRRWPVGLSRKPQKAMAFYTVIALSVVLGIGLNFTPLDPIKALYWSAVINGVLAAPVMVLLMLRVRKRDVMGDFVVPGWLYGLGWLSTGAMALCIVGMAITAVIA